MIRFELVTLNGVVYSEDVAEVVLPTLSGYIGVLTGHMPLVSVATTGMIRVRKNAQDPDDMMEVFASNGGVIEVSDNKLSVLVDEADHGDDINEKEAQEAYERAKKMAETAKDKKSLDEAMSLMDRQATRIKVAEIRRHKRRV